jgi:hypothetical protein
MGLRDFHLHAVGHPVHNQPLGYHKSFLVFQRWMADGLFYHEKKRSKLDARENSI